MILSSMILSQPPANPVLLSKTPPTPVNLVNSVNSVQPPVNPVLLSKLP